jgi:protein disulfide-isomerase
MKKIILFLLITTSLQLKAQEVKVNNTSEAPKKEALVWHNDLNKAIPLSINSKKPILLFFTGSDWCGWCIRLQREVFHKEDFKKWTDENVILVELDFPRRKQLPANIAQQNRELQQIFGVRGYPTVWLVTPEIIKSTDSNNPSSKINFQKLGSLGYVAGGPEKWISAANQFLKNSENNIAPKN